MHKPFEPDADPTRSMDPEAAAAEEPGRGRDAKSPTKIPLRGWKDVLLRVKSEVEEDQISMVAASVAFYLLLAMFPALIAMLAVYGLFADRALAAHHVRELASALPSETSAMLGDQIEAIATASNTSLGFGLLVSLGGALWAASGGIQALMVALNVAYDEKEKRGFVKQRAIAVGLTLAALTFAVLVLVVVGGVPIMLDQVGLGFVAETAIIVLRWPAIALMAMVGLSVLYRYAPSRAPARWRWITPGSGLASLAWILVTFGFTFVVSKFGSYNETYGAIGGVIVLMLWLHLTAFCTLLGAELDCELERQTTADSTVGREKPIGKRGAYSADTVGKSYR